MFDLIAPIAMLDPSCKFATSQREDLPRRSSEGRRGRECVTTAGRQEKDAHSESCGVVTDSCRIPVRGVGVDSCGWRVGGAVL